MPLLDQLFAARQYGGWFVFDLAIVKQQENKYGRSSVSFQKTSRSARNDRFHFPTRMDALQDWIYEGRARVQAARQFQQLMAELSRALSSRPEKPEE
jgi:hypothetical protein